MKKIVIYPFMLLLALAACRGKEDGYLLRGKIAGEADGMKAALMDAYAYPPVTIDSAVIRNGQFLMKGRVEYPGMYMLVIDPVGEGNEEDLLASKFYLENSAITFSGHIDSLPTYYWRQDRPVREAVVTGSASQDLFLQYQAENRELDHQYSEIYNEYMEVYHLPALDGVFHTEEGIGLARRMAVLDQAKQAAQWAFIVRHPSSIVAYDLASQFVEGMYVNLTASQIDELEGIIRKGWAAHPEKADEFVAKAEKAKPLALGSKYRDIELINLKGEKVRLADYVPEGKYVMLEFWASWCGPCRGEIPHLRHVYETYKDKGFEIVSISIDNKRSDWEKAVREENMAWTQLCDPLMFDGPVTQMYNVTGVPTCLLLDKEGRIFKTDMRGAILDAVLEEVCP